MERVFERWLRGNQVDGWLIPFSKALLDEHKRAVRVVEREIANLEAIKSRSFCNAEIAEAYASITVLRDILAALQRGREGVMEPMYWTRNKPTEAGFWWWRNEGVDPDVVWVEMRGKCLMYQSMIGWQHLSGTGGEWSSTPIAMPQEVE